MTEKTVQPSEHLLASQRALGWAVEGNGPIKDRQERTVHVLQTGVHLEDTAHPVTAWFQAVDLGVFSDPVC